MIADVSKELLLMKCYEIFVICHGYVCIPINKTSNIQLSMVCALNLNMFIDGLYILEIFGFLLISFGICLFLNGSSTI